MRHPTILVSVENGSHVCKPKETTVRAEDTVKWEGERGEKLSVQFPKGSPFKEANGEFDQDHIWTVSSPAQKGRFTPDIKIDGRPAPNATRGDIIVDD